MLNDTHSRGERGRMIEHNFATKNSTGVRGAVLGGEKKKERENFQGTSDGKLFARELDKFFLKLESQTEQDSSAHSLARFKKHHFGRRALKKPAGQMASLRNTGKRVDISTVTRLTAICGLSHRFQAPVERSYYTCTPPKKNTSMMTSGLML